MSEHAAISTRGLTKRYPGVVAVDGLDLDVRRGEIYGFLGRNGAGKTTTIRMLLGLVRPDAGEVRILGTRVGPGRWEIFARVGYLVETATAYPNLTTRENLEVQRRLTGAPPSSVDEALDAMGLRRQAERRAGQLSLGNKQRLSLARALLHRPDVLVLDEPANTLDPAGIAEIRALLRRLTDDDGVTVFMSSHILSEVSQLADRIGIVHDGRLVEELDRDELRERARPYLDVRTNEPAPAERLLMERGFSNVERTDAGLRILDSEGRAAEVARLLVEAGLDVEALIPGREDLESHFLRVTGVGA